MQILMSFYLRFFKYRAFICYRVFLQFSRLTYPSPSSTTEYLKTIISYFYFFKPSSPSLHQEECWFSLQHLKASVFPVWEGLFIARSKNSPPHTHTHTHSHTASVCYYPTQASAEHTHTLTHAHRLLINFLGAPGVAAHFTDSQNLSMPSLRHSYTVTAAEEPASLPGSERANLRRKSPPLSRTKLVTTFMGLIINQAKVSPKHCTLIP